MSVDQDTPQFRPQLHFTPERNWMNDPNGLVYFKGEYHLFFQYNPYGKNWGHMSWGHAVSTDLVHWTELPVAIPEGNQMIFSGCAVVDWKNVSELGADNEPPLLAYFTAHDPRLLVQTQHMAFSNDNGRSWRHHPGNPIIDLNLEHFRDPKVFYHHASSAWVMVVALPRAHKVQFYRSHNLLDWTLGGEFGPAGGTGGQWECPDLIEVAVESDGGTSNRKYWVLKIDVDRDFLEDGSGAQYFIGDFDGYTFAVNTDVGPPDGEILDIGPDFYAAVSWSDLPEGHEAPVLIGWMSNHQSGHQYPTHPWRGTQSIPRVLSLMREGGKLRVRQRPVSQLAAVSTVHRHHLNYDDSCTEPLRLDIDNGVAEVFVEITKCERSGVYITLADSQSSVLTVSLDFAHNELTIARAPSEHVPKDCFSRRATSSLDLSSGVSLHVLIDRSLVEIFINDGSRTYSACIFPVGTLQLSVGLVQEY